MLNGSAVLQWFREANCKCFVRHREDSDELSGVDCNGITLCLK